MFPDYEIDARIIQGSIVIINGLIIMAIVFLYLLAGSASKVYVLEYQAQEYYHDLFVFWGTTTLLLITLIVCLISVFRWIKHSSQSQYLFLAVVLFEIFGVAVLFLLTRPIGMFAIGMFAIIFSFPIVSNVLIFIFGLKQQG